MTRADRSGAPDFGAEYFDEAYGGEYDRRNPPRKTGFYLAQIRRLKPSGTLLDVGCAYGAFLAGARGVYDASGCDVSGHAVRVAAERLPGTPVFRAGVGELPAGRRYDVVTCFDVLEHVPDLPGAFERLSGCLAPHGLLALTVPVYNGLPGAIVRRLDRDPTHVWKEGGDFWRDALRSRGFDILRDIGLWRHFFLSRYLFLGSGLLRNFSPALMLIGSRR